MSITKDDIRAAVSAGAIDEKQAASILALSQSRQGYRENIEGLDEPFELFRGFNEVFIVIGLTILYSGWAGLTGLASFRSSGGAGLILLSLVGMICICFLAKYFTLNRRMVAPSIALTIMFGLSALQFGLGIIGGSGSAEGFLAAVVFGIFTIALFLYWAFFRVPFAMLLIALGVFATCFALTTLGGAEFDHPRELFLLSADGPFSFLTFVLGLIGVAIALRFDMSDPHRVTRRSANGFWLHIIAAPAIVNTVALTLFQASSVFATLALMVFITFMALFAVAIDRRSFLISGIGYVVALSVSVIEGQAFLVILIIGVGLVLLGAQWETLRRSLMNKLPDFRGKDRLPPWNHTKETE